VRKRKQKTPAERASAKKRATAKKRAVRRSKPGKWVKFVEKHGIVLASARGAVPSVAEAVVGEPIVGSWWAHPKGRAIFAALSELDDSPDVRCFKLIDGKVTLVHRRLWPALVKLGRAGAIARERLAALQQEHMPTGEHRNLVTPFPDWVDDDTDKAAATTSSKPAEALLGL
jgi:hypothetical protein